MTERLSNYQAIKRAGQVGVAADIQASKEARRKLFITKTLALDTAKDQYSPERVDFNFRTFWVMGATDANTSVQLIPNVREEGQLNDAIKLTQNLALRLPGPASGGQIYWSSQPGKSITILFLVDGEVTPGSLISQITGGVNQSDGTAVFSSALGAAGTSGSLAATTSAAILCPANANRKVTTVQITGGNARVGDNTVAKGGPGLLVYDGQIVSWRNTGALYWIIESGAPVAVGNEET